MPYRVAGPLRQFYELTGTEGPWITLINGFSRPGDDFKVMARHLSRAGMRVLVPDNRGAGATESPLDFSFADLVGDIPKLWEELKIEQSHLLGISFGGVIAQGVSLNYLARVSSLTLVSTTPSSAFLNPAYSLSASEGEPVEQRLQHYVSAGFRDKNPLLFKALMKATAEVFADPERRARASAQRRALGEFDFRSKLQALSCPALVVHGTEDEVVLPEAANAFQESLPNARLRWFEGKGHLLLAEAPKQLYETVEAFCLRGR